MDRTARRVRRAPHERAFHHRGPRQGRLQQNAEPSFARAGLALVKPWRPRLPGRYRPICRVFEVAYLSASEITELLAQGPCIWRHRRGPGARDDRGCGCHVVLIEGLGSPRQRGGRGARSPGSTSQSGDDDLATAFRLNTTEDMRVATK